MTDESDRQLVLAKLIGRQFHDTEKLIPLGHHSSFCGDSRYPLWPSYYRRVCDVAWLAVAAVLNEVAGLKHVIDHAWLLGFSGPPHEPWGLVTEPYLDEEAAVALCRAAHDAMAGWGLRIESLDPANSSWNPGRCCPVVATFDDGGIEPFMRHSIAWWFRP